MMFMPFCFALMQESTAFVCDGFAFADLFADFEYV
jgi:hypothetical protein